LPAIPCETIKEAAVKTYLQIYGIYTSIVEYNHFTPSDEPGTWRKFVTSCQDQRHKYNGRLIV